MVDKLLPLGWLTQQDAATKHTASWKHPIAACLIHYIVSSLVIVSFHDGILLRSFLENENVIVPSSLLPSFSMCHETPRPTRFTIVGRLSLTYAFLLLIVRLISNPSGVHRYSILYDFTWLCNGALFFGGSFGFLTCRPHIATGFAIAVSVDQLMWYVDAIGFAINYYINYNNNNNNNTTTRNQQKKMFPIGVCQYLTWKQTQWSAKLTCTHHFWTIPLFLYGSAGGSGGGLDWGSYIMNVVTVSSYVLLSRWLTPFGLNPSPKQQQQQQGGRRRRFEKYMNVNLSHELWQDIKIDILRNQADKNQSTMIYLIRLILWWQLFNLLCFLFLRTLLVF